MGTFQCQPFCDQNTAMRPGFLQNNQGDQKGYNQSFNKANSGIKYGQGRLPFGNQIEAVVYEVQHPDEPGTKLKYEVCCSSGQSSRHQGAFCGLKPIKKVNISAAQARLATIGSPGSIDEETDAASTTNCCNMAELVCSHYERLNTEMSTKSSEKQLSFSDGNHQTSFIVLRGGDDSTDYPAVDAAANLEFQYVPSDDDCDDCLSFKATKKSQQSSNKRRTRTAKSRMFSFKEKRRGNHDSKHNSYSNASDQKYSHKNTTTDNNGAF